MKTTKEFVVSYLVPTASGNYNEHQIITRSRLEARNIVRRCNKLGYEVNRLTIITDEAELICVYKQGTARLNYH